tara:strand:+ start:103 stop:327 length:225 start_codon:yes stop_codon:yes gene_type:complete
MSTTKKTLVEACKEARAAELDGWTDENIAIAKQVNRLAQLMDGDKQAAALALIYHLLSAVINGTHSINVNNRGN